MKGFRHNVLIAAGDTDLVGYVYHVNFFRFMEAARWAYLRDKLGAGSALADIARRTMVRNASCEFLSPVCFGETLSLHVQPLRIGKSSYDFEFACYANVARGLVARGVSTQVYVDPVDHKSAPLPVALHSAILQELNSHGSSPAAQREPDS